MHPKPTHFGTQLGDPLDADMFKLRLQTYFLTIIDSLPFFNGPFRNFLLDETVQLSRGVHFIDMSFNNYAGGDFENSIEKARQQVIAFGADQQRVPSSLQFPQYPFPNNQKRSPDSMSPPGGSREFKRQKTTEAAETISEGPRRSARNVREESPSTSARTENETPHDNNPVGQKPKAAKTRAKKSTTMTGSKASSQRNAQGTATATGAATATAEATTSTTAPRSAAEKTKKKPQKKPADRASSERVEGPTDMGFAAGETATSTASKVEKGKARDPGERGQSAPGPRTTANQMASPSSRSNVDDIAAGEPEEGSPEQAPSPPSILLQRFKVDEEDEEDEGDEEDEEDEADEEDKENKG